MSALLGLLERLRPWRLTDHQIRAEAWALGVRHQGEIRAGAQQEARAPNISLRRAILLRAVLRGEKARERAGDRTPSGRP